MIKIGKHLLSLGALLVLFSLGVRAQGPSSAPKPLPITRFLILMDFSGSMWGEWEGSSKIQVARRVVTHLVDSLSKIPGVELGLRLYGHQSATGQRDCKDTRLEVPFLKNNAAAIKTEINTTKPNGTTPIAYSLTEAAFDFPKSPGKNIILLITDGVEECGGDPCAVSAALQARGVLLKPLVIGLGMTEEYSASLQCVGRYFNVARPGDFSEVLSQVVDQVLNITSVQVLLNDAMGKPTTTNVNMTFYNTKTGAIAYNLYHTIGPGNVPDTFNLDPSIEYNLVVNTLPQVRLNNIKLKAAAYNAIIVSAPVGYLGLSVGGNSYYQLACLVKKAGEAAILNVQTFKTTTQYLAGTYDLEVLTLPRLFITGVVLGGGRSTPISIPEAGTLDLNVGNNVDASLYVMRNGKQEWVIDITRRDNIAKTQYSLQPGNYRIVARPAMSRETLDSRTSDFKITSGGATNVTVN